MNSTRRKMIEAIEKGGGIDGTDDSGIRYFLALVSVEEDHRRGTDNVKALHQGSAVIIVVGRVRTGQVKIGQAVPDTRLGKNRTIHHLAFDAPLGRKIENDRPAGFSCPRDRVVERLWCCYRCEFRRLGGRGKSGPGNVAEPKRQIKRDAERRHDQYDAGNKHARRSRYGVRLLPTTLS